MCIFSGCSSSENVGDNTLEISKDDEKLILNYLDNNTNDLASTENGKMYSAYKVLGTSQEKIFLWVIKIEFKYKEGKLTKEEGESVAAPIVLNIKKNGKSFSIIGHQLPKEGKDYPKSIKKLFPSDMVFPDDDYSFRLKLKESILARVEEDINKNQ